MLTPTQSPSSPDHEDEQIKRSKSRRLLIELITPRVQAQNRKLSKDYAKDLATSYVGMMEYPEMYHSIEYRGYSWDSVFHIWISPANPS